MQIPTSKITIALILLLTLGVAMPVIGQKATLTPDPYQTLLNNAGQVVVGGCIWTYQAGTTTPATTWSDVNQLSPNTNPIITDSAGRYLIFLQPGLSYKYTIEQACTPPAHGTLIRTQDNISSIPLQSRTTVSSSLTGTLNNFNPGIVGDTVLEMANSSAATITGFPAGVAGQRITVIATNSSVAFTYLDSGSTIGNRLLLKSTSAMTLAAGVSTNGTASFVYDAGQTRWVLDTFDQGDLIPYTPIWGNTGTANTLGNGGLSGVYRQSGVQIWYRITLNWGSTTVAGSSVWTFSVPIAADTAGPGGSGALGVATHQSPFSVWPLSAQNQNTTSFQPLVASAPTVNVTSSSPFTWASGDTLLISGWYTVP